MKFDKRIEVDSEGNGIIQLTEEEAAALKLELGHEYELVLVENDEGEVTGIDFKKVEKNEDSEG